ncbi:hypothetical protein NOCA2190045 [metagenome]|uniref:Uncharacterized protein n=1 Tax=metagenome TaxID=256318 RepID=A0A2P2BXW2_9ZZZZ
MRPVVYRPAERPEVEVLVDGRWHYGQLRMWTRHDSGWRAQVTWTRDTAENRIDSFPSERVRKLEPDR